MVRLEIDRRLMLKGKYSGTDILTAKLRCGECGGSYGAKFNAHSKCISFRGRHVFFFLLVCEFLFPISIPTAFAVYVSSFII